MQKKKKLTKDKNNQRCKPIDYLKFKNRFRIYKNKNSKKADQVEAHSYLFINPSTSFVLISPTDLDIFYDEIYTYNNEVEMEITRVYYQGFDFILKKKFEKLIELYEKWGVEVHGLSTDAHKRIRNNMRYIEVEEAKNPQNIYTEILGKNGDFSQNGYQYFLCFPSDMNLEKLKKKLDFWDVNSPIYQKKKLNKLKHWNISKRLKKKLEMVKEISVCGFKDSIDKERDIVYLNYGKKSAYTIDLAFENPKKISAFEFKERIRKITNIKNSSDQHSFDQKFRYVDSKLKLIPLDKFLFEIQPKEKSHDDFCDLREIDFHHGFTQSMSEKIFVLSPLSKISSFDYTNKSKMENLKKTTEINSPIYSGRPKKKANRRSGKSKILIRAMRHLNIKFYSIQEYDTWGKIPSIINNFERQINLKPFFSLSETNTRNKIKRTLWHAFQGMNTNSFENYDCLETVGDSLLKFMVVFFLISVSDSNQSEGYLSSIKSKCVSNKRLKYLAVQSRLQYFLQTNVIFRDSWKFPLFQKNLLKKKKSLKSSMIHSKNIADVYEAILGGLVIDNSNILDSVKFLLFTNFWEFEKKDCLDEQYRMLMKVLGHKRQMNQKIIIEDDCKISEWFLGKNNPGTQNLNQNLSFEELWNMNKNQKKSKLVYDSIKHEIRKNNLKLRTLIKEEIKGDKSSGEINTWIEEKYLPNVEKVLGYEFKNKSLLRFALTVERKNQPRDLDWNNNLERLEFLGDAVFELVLIASLYKCSMKKNRKFTPKLMTEGKIFLLSNLSMMKFASLANLHHFAIGKNQEIEEFGEYVKKKFVDHNCLKFEKFKMKKNKSLSDVWEAVAGALIVDGGWPAVEKVLKPTMSLFVTFFSEYMTIMKMNYKSDALTIMSIEKSLKIQKDRDDEGKSVLRVLYGNNQECLHEFMMGNEESDEEETYEEAYIFIVEYFSSFKKKVCKLN